MDAVTAALGTTAVLVFYGVKESTFVPNIDNQAAAKSRMRGVAPIFTAAPCAGHQQSLFYQRDCDWETI